MGRTIYHEVSVDIDVDDIIDEIETEDLIEELENRGYEVGMSRDEQPAFNPIWDCTGEECDKVGEKLANSTDSVWKMRRLIAAYLALPWGTDIQTLCDMLAARLNPRLKAV